jgi:hypothetical protein
MRRVRSLICVLRKGRPGLCDQLHASAALPGAGVNVVPLPGIEVRLSCRLLIGRFLGSFILCELQPNLTAYSALCHSWGEAIAEPTFLRMPARVACPLCDINCARAAQ